MAGEDRKRTRAETLLAYLYDKYMSELEDAIRTIASLADFMPVEEDADALADAFGDVPGEIDERED